ncbi:VanZ family protein [Rhodococcus sp. BP22]|uniref:VanZ family protein n=1 Tax=Rhodococcus sp. BP22 TaxID=2758566 RepID=UPI0021BDCDFF|nr:VanZ family protein [Rhodococcus sp. BP22]
MPLPLRSHMALPLRYYVPLALALIAALIILFTPASGVPSGFTHSDKIIHFTLFFALAYTSRIAAVSALRTVLWTTTFAIASEILQAVLPLGRSGSLLDTAFDVAGAAVGVLVATRIVPTHSAIH